MSRSSWLLSSLLIASAVATAAVGAPAAGRQHLVACAPGYPGSTEQAQPTMDELAASLAAAGGWPVDAVSAEYQSTEAEGLARLADPATTLGLVPLPFFLAHEEELDLRPLAQVVRRDGSAAERWSLVAPRGRVRSSADLAGWELHSIAAYSARFVRGPALGGWGVLGDDVAIAQPRRLLSSLRRAMAGEPVALLLDEEQAAALADLPGAESLEVIASSPPLLAAIVATVGDRVSATDRDALLAALLALDEETDSAELMETMRVSAFADLDEAMLQQARDAYRATR